MIILTGRSSIIVRHTGSERLRERTNVAIFVTAVVVGRNWSRAAAYLEGILLPCNVSLITAIDGNCTEGSVFGWVLVVVWGVDRVLGAEGSVYAHHDPSNL
jgi:hypothetical protein